jgi:hypothetical protein
MVLISIVVALAIVFAIAAAVIGREANRLAAQPPRPVFDLEAAVAFVADRLPFEVAAQLSHDDVRQLIRWHLDYFRIRGVSANGDSQIGMTAPVVVGGSETVDYLLERAGQAGLEVDATQVHAVVERQMEYLRSIGAIGPPADDPEAEPPA